MQVMRIITGVFLGGTAISIACVPAYALIMQPLDTLANIYGHSEQIANGVVNGSIKGLNVNQSTVNSDINSMQNGNSQAPLQSLTNVYTSLNQLNQ